MKNPTKPDKDVIFGDSSTEPDKTKTLSILGNQYEAKDPLLKLGEAKAETILGATITSKAP